jgi:hypothetical protein
MQSALMFATSGLFRLRQHGKSRFFLWFLAASGQKPKKKKSCPPCQSLS